MGQHIEEKMGGAYPMAMPADSERREKNKNKAISTTPQRKLLYCGGGEVKHLLGHDSKEEAQAPEKKGGGFQEFKACGEDIKKRGSKKMQTRDPKNPERRRNIVNKGVHRSSDTSKENNAVVIAMKTCAGQKPEEGRKKGGENRGKMPRQIKRG